MSFVYERQIKDANFVKTKALPSAGSSNNTATFDTGARTGFFPEEIGVEVSVPALTAHTDSTKDVTIKVQHSDDDSSYADLDDGVTGTVPDITFAIPGVTTDGSAARIVRFRLPTDGLKRYVQFNQAVTSGGPTLTGSSVTYSLLF